MLAEILHKLIIALFSGFTEFFSVSATPHLLLYESLTGYSQNDAVLTLMIRIGCLLAVIFACKKRIIYLLRANRLERITRRRKNRHLDMNAIREGKMLKTAVIPLLIAVLFYRQTASWVSGPAMLALVMLINGFIIFLPRVMPQGNKDSSMMSPLDSLVVGICGALSVIPGISRMAGLLTGAMARGTEQSYALEYALLLSVPVLILMTGIDIYLVLVSAVAVTTLQLVIWIVAGFLAFGSAYLGILLVRFVAMKTGLHAFCYYSWGVAMFSFVLYLLV